MRFRFERSAISEGLRSLQDELTLRGHDVKLLRIGNTTSYRPLKDHMVINWGNSNPRIHCHLNASSRIGSDKVACFQALARHGIASPDFTHNCDVAKQWIDEGSQVVCRTLSRSSSGAGIVMAENASELVTAPLYTRYIKKSDEYRVHVVGSKVIDQQRKARNTEVPDEDVDWQVRTHDNGFIYMRENVDLPPHALLLAIEAARACSLEFGAVDLIYNKHYDSYYVLEINTAPGLTGTTVSKYADAFEEYHRENF